MSDTPKTDAAVYLTKGPNFNAVCPNFARKLERENATLREELEQLRQKVPELERENAALRASAAESNEYARKHVEAYYELMELLGRDRGRLDFLESTTGSGWALLHLDEGKQFSRKAIDRRMATEPKP